MESIEPVDVLNKRLRDVYGIDIVTGMPIWRIVWSEDQYEMRQTDYDDRGNQLLTSEVRLLPKYKQWINEKWILENLVLVPNQNRNELADAKISYECIYVFEDIEGNFLPAKWEACEFTISCIKAMKGDNKPLRKYLGDSGNLEDKQKRLDSIEEQLFGDVSSLGYRTVTGEAVAGFHSKIELTDADKAKKIGE